MKNSIIVASHTLTPTRKLSDESKLRIDKGIELFEQKVANFIIMNGGPGKQTNGEFVPRGTHPVQCEVMKEYAVELGIPAENILMQDFSSDTVGEAYFVKEMYLALKDWKDNIVVTSAYHVKRSNIIYELILGLSFITDFVGIETNLDDDPDTLAHEKESLEIFLEQFGALRTGDSPSFEKILYEKHKIYPKIPEKERLKYYD